jgi:alpha-tubulin suppressor-like RCC1 family protein
MDNNNKGYKSFAIVSNYSSTAYSANNCTTCTGGYGSTSAWADYEGNYWYHLGDMAYAGIREADGTLWTWGYNENGLLGNNTAGFSTSTKSPVQLGSNSWKMVVGSSRQNTLGWFVAIRSDDTLWAWGYNGDGQLGDGTTTSRSSPVQVSGGGAWKYIAVGRYSTVGIKTDGTLHGWGSNGSGELGDGTTTNRSSPVQISGGGTWKKVVRGVNGSLGIKTDGTAYGWGYNGYYCLGFGTNAFRSSPVQVSGGYSDWTDVSLPYYDYWGYGIRSNGTLWGWGTYVYGLSLTYPYYYSVPVQIGSATNFASCSIDNGSVDYWSYDKPGPVFITNIGNVVNFQGYNSTQTILYSGSYAVQFIRPTGNYYANAFLMKYVP